MSLLWEYDQALIRKGGWVVGVDEAGRGALAGPVVAGAVVLAAEFFEAPHHRDWCSDINDSKQLPEKRRDAIFGRLQAWSRNTGIGMAWGSASVEEIESLNILGATRLAMIRALEFLHSRSGKGWILAPSAPDDLIRQEHPGYDGSSAGPSAILLVDGRRLNPFPYAHEALVKGDCVSLSIAMASVVAKVTRDRWMRELAVEHRHFGFDYNKGYGTPGHLCALRTNGPCSIHRPSFLKRQIEAESAEQGRLDF